MPLKINISEKSGKTYHLEFEGEDFNGKELRDKIEGKIIMPELEGYEFEIAGASDNAGFTSHESVTGIGLKKIILSYEKGMKKRPKREGKWKRTDVNPRGLRLRKTVRGKSISAAIAQINLKTLKEGAKKLSEIFPDQNQPKIEAPKIEDKQIPETIVKEALKTEKENKPEASEEEVAPASTSKTPTVPAV